MAGAARQIFSQTAVVYMSIIWSNSAQAAGVAIDFSNNAWLKNMNISSHNGNRAVVPDPKKGEGQVLMITYHPSYLYGTQFDFPFFTNNPQQVCLSYQVLFKKGFDFAKGGKLPGLYGGSMWCSGAMHDNCFSTRMMWRKGGAGEVYIYMTREAENRSRGTLCAPAGQSGVMNECSPTYGWSFKRGAVSFSVDKWNIVRQRVRMNSMDKADGELEVWVNEKNISASGLTWRTSGDGVTIKGLFFSTFFGGHNSSWAPSKEVRAYFKDIHFEECSDGTEIRPNIAHRPEQTDEGTESGPIPPHQSFSEYLYLLWLVSAIAALLFVWPRIFGRRVCWSSR